MTARSLDTIDPTFVDDLKRSNDSVWLVAHWLQRHGYHVVVRGLRIRPDATPDAIAEYSDLGDVEIIQRIEVKQRSDVFTGAADFPYPRVLVCSVHTWDRAHPKPYAVVILNAARTVAAIVKADTADQWAIDTFANNGRTQRAYFCPLTCARFVTVDPS